MNSLYLVVAQFLLGSPINYYLWGKLVVSKEILAGNSLITINYSQACSAEVAVSQYVCRCTAIRGAERLQVFSYFV
jgi:hypothetical protein